MKSSIFYTDQYITIAQHVTNFLNARQDYLSAISIKSPRAVGDAIQDVLADDFNNILADERIKYSTGFARRAMADLAFEDTNGFYYVVDVKTHRLHDTKFNMPNLTSVERLARFYQDDKNYFVVLFISYEVVAQVVVRQTRFIPIEFLSWSCLTLGALGWGQIQIANSSVLAVNPGYPRKRWMIELCDNLLDFYPREINKIGQRVEYFQKVKAFWENKPEE